MIFLLLQDKGHIHPRRHIADMVKPLDQPVIDDPEILGQGGRQQIDEQQVGPRRQRGQVPLRPRQPLGL